MIAFAILPRNKNYQKRIVGIAANARISKRLSNRCKFINPIKSWFLPSRDLLVLKK
jgi:hypothetical protein